ncbi:MAG: serine/threonine-protein kinase [Nibricoccus sp.]
MTKAERTCHRCGLVFVSEKLDGLCPSCLLTNTLDLEDRGEEHAFWEDEKPAPSLGRAFSHFDIIEELGRGGMGTVYRARDHVTGRTVALKILQAHHLDEPDLVKRFRSEVRAVTSLDHRNILPIHEVGEHDGIPFFSMKLATGGSLAQRLPEYLGNPRQCAELLAKISRGIQHAHEHGILHRDLKPGNILLDDAGEPYVCDFGLAKWIEDDRRLTITSAVLGTPHYIAPEQASGKKGLTTAADIYSLGAILYELLTGRPPFVGESVIDTLRQASECTPAKPSSIVNHTPRDLEIICLKALEREPEARYKTALALAQDLENWIEGRPIRARPVSAAEQLWRWARRNPLPATLGAVLAAAITALAVGSTIAAININAARKRAVIAEKDAVEQLYNALLAQARASRMTNQAGHRIEALEAIKKAAAIRPSIELRNEAIAALTLVDVKTTKSLKVRKAPLQQPSAFDTKLETVAVATEEGDINILSLKNGESQRIIKGAGKPILSLIHSGTRYLAARCTDDAVYIYECATGRRVALFPNRKIPRQIGYTSADCMFSQDETLLSLGSSDGVDVIDLLTAKTIATTKTIHPEQIAISPDNRLAVFDAPIPTQVPYKEKFFYLWSFKDDEPVAKVALNSYPSCFAWSPDLQWLAVGCSDYSIQIFRTSDWQNVGSLIGHRQPPAKIAFNHRSDMIVSNSGEFTLRLWDVRTLTQLVEAAGHGSESAANFSPDDRFLGTFSGQSAKINEIVGLRRICMTFAPSSTNEQTQKVSSLDFSPDSKLLARASINSVQIVDAKKGLPLSTISLPSATQTSLRFLADNQTLAVLSRKSGLSFHRYSYKGEKFEISLGDPQSEWATYAFGAASYDGSAYFGLTSDKETKGIVWDHATGKTLLCVDNAQAIQDLAISPNKKWAVIAYLNRTHTIWSLATAEKIAELSGVQGGTITFSPSGRWLGVTGKSENILWETEHWTKGPALPREIEEKASAISFSYDERFLAVRILDQTAILALPSGELLAMLEQRILPATASRLKFSPDGSQLALHGLDNSLVLWNLQELRNELNNLGLNWR